MLYMLDTNIVSYLLEEDPHVIEAFDNVFLKNDICISNVVQYEIQRGIYYRKSKKLQKQFDKFCRIIPVCQITDDDFDEAAKIYAYLRQEGKLIEDSDIFIGATAIVNNAIIVTNNETHLSRIRGLRIENWTNVE